jgi:hypothetical protein
MKFQYLEAELAERQDPELQAWLMAEDEEH